MSSVLKYPIAAFVAQLFDPKGPAPWNSRDAIAAYVAQHGGTSLQLIPGDPFIDLPRAAESRDYCQQLQGEYVGLGLPDSYAGGISSHIAGQLVAVHPAYREQLAGFASSLKDPSVEELSRFGTEQMKLIIAASANSGLDFTPSFTGSLLWPYIYQWPQRPNGLVETALAEQVHRWTPIVAFAAERGVKLGFELHPGEDAYDLDSFERFRSGFPAELQAFIAVNLDLSHVVLQCADPIEHTKIALREGIVSCYHVKDAVADTGSGRHGCYRGLHGWSGKGSDWSFQTPGLGEIDFTVVDALLARYGFEGARTLEWECTTLPKAQGVSHGLNVIRKVRAGGEYPDAPEAEGEVEAFDNFASTSGEAALIRRLLGLTLVTA
jgi:sugar phosphate isomerase/epimerase